jgi:hypothetical protein
MIDAGPSLKAAERVSGRALATYLLTQGWAVRPSRVEGVSILSKHIDSSDEPVEFILPLKSDASDGPQRVADALRTVAAVENRSIQEVVRAVQDSTRDAVPMPVTPAGVADEEELPAAFYPLDSGLIGEISSLSRWYQDGGFNWNRDIFNWHRDFIEGSEHVERALDLYIVAARGVVNMIVNVIEARAVAAGKDIGLKVFADQNVGSSFDFAQKLIHAKTVQDVVRLQSEFIRRQRKMLEKQAKELKHR